MNNEMQNKFISIADLTVCFFFYRICVLFLISKLIEINSNTQKNVERRKVRLKREGMKKFIYLFFRGAAGV
jgi:hypothetical protein